MKAAVLTGIRKMEIREIADPAIHKDSDVLLRVGAVGVCGSDVHYYVEGRIGRYIVEKPLVLGHECAGEIVEVGANVQHLAVGDPVAVQPGIPCRRCSYCKTGRYNLCAEVVFMATPPM